MNRFGIEISDDLLKELGLDFTTAEWEANADKRTIEELLDAPKICFPGPNGDPNNSEGYYMEQFWRAFKKLPRFRWHELLWGYVGERKGQYTYWKRIWEDEHGPADPNRVILLKENND